MIEIRLVNSPQATPADQEGLRNKVTLATESLLQGQANALTQTASTKVLEGDSVALRLCMERIAPAPEDQPDFINSNSVIMKVEKVSCYVMKIKKTLKGTKTTP